MSQMMCPEIVDEVCNPQLVKFEAEFGISISNYAFVIQCGNYLAPDLLRLNPYSTIPRYEELEIIEEIENLAERETPGVDTLPTAWLFPPWRPNKVLYVFGTLDSHCDIVLPLDTATSRAHFAVYLSHSGIWMARNLSRYGTWVNGTLLGLPEPGQAATESALNPETSNVLCAGVFHFFIHPIPHSARSFRIDQAISRLSNLGIPSEGSRTTSATESSSVIFRPSIISGERYEYLNKNPIPVQGDSQVYRAIKKASGKYHIAKKYPFGDRGKAVRQHEMMLLFKVSLTYL